MIKFRTKIKNLKQSRNGLSVKLGAVEGLDASEKSELGSMVDREVEVTVKEIED